MRRAGPFSLAVALLTLTLAMPALAGGWAVTTLDSLPDRFVAGETYELGYTIRQHGVTPVNVDKTQVRISEDGGKRLSFDGIRDGGTGHYIAKVSFPKAGAWTWEVTQEPFAPHALGPITAVAPPLAAGQASAPPVPAQQPRSEPLIVLGIALALAGAIALFGTRIVAYARPARA